MQFILQKWIRITYFNLILVAVLGLLMRYKIAFYLPLIQQKHVLHSHSHFAFAGWVTQALMVLMVHYLASREAHGNPIVSWKKYRWLLIANLVMAYGMLVSFFMQGYGFVSISFSTLSIFVSYAFAVFYWKDLDRLKPGGQAHHWFKAGLLFSVISSLGAFGLAIMMANKIAAQNSYLALIYFFLHFQYNGWFFFAGMGLLVSRFEKMGMAVQKIRLAFWLFALACIPAYLLSALWLPFPQVIYFLLVAAVIAQVWGWAILVKFFTKNKEGIVQHFSKMGRILLLLAAIAFSIKLLLQSFSVHPALSQLSYTFRPIIIGYLHLVLLAVTSIFILGYNMAIGMFAAGRVLVTGMYIFVAGIIVNELLLMVQGISAMAYIPVSHINEWLMVTAIILLTGAVLIFAGSRPYKKNEVEMEPHS